MVEPCKTISIMTLALVGTFIIALGLIVMAHAIGPVGEHFGRTIFGKEKLVSMNRCYDNGFDDIIGHIVFTVKQYWPSLLKWLPVCVKSNRLERSFSHQNTTLHSLQIVCNTSILWLNLLTPFLLMFIFVLTLGIALTLTTPELFDFR